MKLPNPSGLISIGRSFVAANRPEILFGTSIVSTLTGVALAAKAGWDSRGQVDAVNAERQIAGEPLLDKKEIAKLTWTNYLPTAGATGISLGSTTGLHLVHVQEKKQLAAAALLAVEQVKKDAVEYKKELTESLGFAKSEDPKELQKAANKSGIAKVVHSDGEVEELYLIRDQKTGRDIWSNRNRIEDAIIDVNRILVVDGSTELNSFYTRAGFASIPEGESMGWSGVHVGLEWDTTVRDDGRPVRTFAFQPEPDPNYDNNYG